ncbi:hypothetical protein J2Y38_004700 [Flavobacterium sp. 2755]|uniref:hypothetical protein n=1 Tax=Flavobacterium sp. 2755 TaxID=2817765 RepID=UPI00285C8166|nr:hypothetical protein [Flavobacterium sp. 2755]MDR6764467.1 hypothetical protein [Flavobacterium sp. 2755]
MKNFLIIILFLISINVLAQEKLKVANETEVYDENGKLFKYYGHGATLDLIKLHEDYAEVEIDCNIYKVQSKFYTKQPKKQVTLGMTNYDVVKILGQPDDTSTFQSYNGISRIYIYGKTYYHFDDDKLTAINSY